MSSYLPKDLSDTLDYAIEHKTQVITTVEAFHKDPELLYMFLNLAANEGVSVHFAPIQTTHQLWKDSQSNIKEEGL